MNEDLDNNEDMQEDEERRKLIQCFQDLFKTPNGEKVLEYLEEVCFMNRSTRNGEDGQGFNNPIYDFSPNTLIVAEARREVVLHIKSMVDFDLSQPILAITSYKENDND